MTSPSEIPSADLHSPSNRLPLPEMPSTYLEQEHLLPLVIAPLFPYPVPYPDVAGRRQVFAFASQTGDPHIRTASQILEASADGLSNLDNTFPPVMPNSVMRSENYLQYVVYSQLREEERPLMYDFRGDSEALYLTVNETSTDGDSVTWNEPGMGDDSEELEIDVTVEDYHDGNESSINDFSLSDKDANTDGSPTIKCSRQGKHKVDRIVLIWTIMKSLLL